MKFISHRGNLNGPTDDENDPERVRKVLSMGYDVEIDVWKKDGEIYLGHDSPNYLISKTFVFQEGLWCHAKNYEALEYLTRCGAHCFFHQEDDYAITSKGFIWAYPGKPTGPNCIAVMPERFGNIISTDTYGICSDYIEDIKLNVLNNT